jgi:putative transposase
VHVAGLTTNPTDWYVGKAVEQAVGRLNGMRYVIHDRDTKYSVRFRIVMEDAGIIPSKTPFQAPNANAYAERFVRSIKDECLNRMILFGEAHLRDAIDEYLERYHGERNHQGIGNVLIDGGPSTMGKIVSSERLGGLPRYYHRAA